MEDAELFRWWIPQAAPKRPYLTRYKMTAVEAAQRYPGLAVRPEMGTREVRTVPTTEEERDKAMAFYQSAGRDGAKPPPKG